MKRYGVYALYAEATDPLKMAEELNNQGFVVVTKKQWEELNKRLATLTAENGLLKKEAWEANHRGVNIGWPTTGND